MLIVKDYLLLLYVSFLFLSLFFIYRDLDGLLFLFYPSISQVKIYDACTNYRSFPFFFYFPEWCESGVSGGWWLGGIVLAGKVEMMTTMYI